MIKRILRKLLQYFFLHGSPTVLTNEQLEEFEAIYLDGLQKGLIEYDSQFPKHLFLEYLAQKKNVLFHGSNNPNIQEFEPRKQTLYNGKWAEAVFATQDPIWPFYYAVLVREHDKGSLRNACLVQESNSNRHDRYYYFSINENRLAEDPWQNGTIYILPREGFNKVGEGMIHFDEWISQVPIQPITKLEVQPQDFPYLTDVVGHKETESIVMSWFKYRLRRKRKLKSAR